MKVLKFGGSSVGSLEAIEQVLGIIQKSIQDDATAIVVSALKGVTDQLQSMADQAANGDEAYQEELRQLERRHIEMIQKIISVHHQSNTLAQLKMLLNELEEVIRGVFLVHEITPRTLDFILGFGERLSAYVLSQYLSDHNLPAAFVDARDLIQTDSNFGTAHVLMEPTLKAVRNHFQDKKKIQVVTGFIGSTTSGVSTTLGRGGSDYTAALLGTALKAEAIEIWTDVTGLMTADPRKVERAFTIPTVSFEEAMELSHFGAEVIYPPTLLPAMQANIPVTIRNTFEPEQAGTEIKKRSSQNKALIKGISSIDDIALLTVKGSGMVGVSGIAARIFTTLAQEKINIILITQASSEHTVCLAVMPDDANRAKQCIEKEFKLELQEEAVDEVLVERELSIVAVVGDHMRNKPGISGRVFNALGHNGINIAAIAQGSSERNISFVIGKSDEAKTLNVLHDAFFLGGVKTINLFLVGIGLIGGTLLKLLQKQQQKLYKNYLIDINLIGLANSRKMLIKPEGVSLENAQNHLDQDGETSSLTDFINRMKQLNKPNTIFVDCTASQQVSEQYANVLGSSISLVTANKKANSGEQSYYNELQQQALQHNVAFNYETNVGAALPVVATTRELVSTGDTIQQIEGVLSGTLSYLFNYFDGSLPFSDLVRQAREKGYTEPDPREDLNGYDVGRKLLILARESGFNLEFKALNIQNLIPEQARTAPDVDAFFEQLAQYDDYFEELRSEAASTGKKLCYIARFKEGKGKAQLEQIDSSHPFFNLSGSDNIVAFTTDHYQETPMVIQGPGAGANVTAGGIIADIIRIANTAAFANGGQ